MIYEKNNKEMRKLLRKFGSTNYGQCMFFICYMPFLLLLLLTITILLIFIKYCCLSACSMLIVKLTFATLISFCVGSFGFYKELREFASNNKSIKKQK